VLEIKKCNVTKTKEALSIFKDISMEVILKKKINVGVGGFESVCMHLDKF
jgi:hypothetical protein